MCNWWELTSPQLLYIMLYIHVLAVIPKLNLLKKTGFVGRASFLRVQFSVFSSPFVWGTGRQVNLETCAWDLLLWLSCTWSDEEACTRTMVIFYSCKEAAELWKKGFLWLPEGETKAAWVTKLFCGILSLNFVSKTALRREPGLRRFSGTALSAPG